MTADADADRSRAVVKTYVPAYQKDAWAGHADDLGMSLSEFVRTMVQAGRRGFGGVDAGSGKPATEASSGPPPSDDLEERVLALLSEDDRNSWEELLDQCVGDFEERLERVLDSLSNDGVIDHSHRMGGYALAVDE